MIAATGIGHVTDETPLEVEMRHISVNMLNMSESVHKLSEAMQQLTAQSMANQERFLNIHQRIDDHDRGAQKIEDSILELTTKIIPKIEQDAAVKGSYWKMAAVVSGAVSVPIASLFSLFGEGFVSRFAATMDARNEAMVRATTEAVVAAVKIVVVGG